MGEAPVALHLSNLETIEDGVMLFTTVLVCFVSLMVLALVGIARPLSLRSGIEMDIYNRNELICAVTLASRADGAEGSSKMRTFVKGEMSVYLFRV